MPGDSARFSSHQACALVEGLLSTPRFSVGGQQMVTSGNIRDKHLSAVRTTEELVVARVGSAHEARGFDRDSAQGVIWLSTPLWPEPVLVFFAERLPADALEPLPNLSTQLDDERGFAWLKEILAEHHIRLSGRAPVRDVLVFVNYRSISGTEEIMLLDEELCRRLGEERVFRDRRLHVGTDYPKALLSKARNTEVLLAVIGRHWEGQDGVAGRRLLDDDDDWIRREISEAFQNGVKVVPIIVGLRQEIASDDLPEDIRPLARLQALHLRHRCTRADVRTLVDEIFAQVPLLAKAQEERAQQSGREPGPGLPR